MPVLFMPVAAGSVAASSSASVNIQPFIVFIFIGLVLISSFIRAAARKSRNQQANRQQQTMAHPVPQQKPGSPTGRAGAAHHASDVPYVGTLLNGVPLKDYDAGRGHQSTGFANERMKAEAELKRQLDALDTARRNGQVDADQYAMHREAIFKNF